MPMCRERQSLKDGYPEKVLGNWLVQGKQVQRFVARSSSLGQMLEPVGTREQETRKSKAMPKGKWRESGK